MALVNYTQNTFVSGTIAEDIWSRLNLPQSTTGLADSLNFLITPFGSATKRPGTYRLPDALGKNTATGFFTTYAAGKPHTSFFADKAAHKIHGNYVSFKDSTTIKGGRADMIAETEVRGTVGTDTKKKKYDDAFYKAIKDKTYSISGQGSGALVAYPYTDNNVQKTKIVTVSEKDTLNEVRFFGPFKDINNDIVITTRSASFSSANVRIKIALSKDIPNFLNQSIMLRTRDPQVDTKLNWLPFSVIAEEGSGASKVYELEYRDDYGAYSLKEMGDYFNKSGSPIIASGYIFKAYRLQSITSTNTPKIVLFSGDRLILAGFPEEPSKIYASNLSDYFTFIPVNEFGAPTATTSWSYGIAEVAAGDIKWLAPLAGGFLIGAAEAEFAMRRSGGTISAETPPVVTRVSSLGSKDYAPVLALDNAVLYTNKSGTKVYRAVYSREIEAIEAKDMSLIAAALFTKAKGVVDMVYDEENTAVWFLMKDGSLLTVTYALEVDVLAWHKHKLATGKVIDIHKCFLDTYTDTVAFIVQDDKNDTYVEYLSLKPFAHEAKFKGNYLDGSWMQYEKDTLPTEKVSTTLIQDAVSVESFKVRKDDKDNVIKSTYQSGIEFEAFIKTTPLILSTKTGQTRGLNLRVQAIHMYLSQSFFGSVSVSYRKSKKSLESFGQAQKPFGKLGEQQESSTGILTLKETAFASGEEPSFKVESTNGFPYTVSAIGIDVDAQGAGSTIGAGGPA